MSYNVQRLIDRLYNVDKRLDPPDLLDIIEYIENMKKEIQQDIQEAEENGMFHDVMLLNKVLRGVSEK